MSNATGLKHTVVLTNRSIKYKVQYSTHLNNPHYTTRTDLMKKNSLETFSDFQW